MIDYSKKRQQRASENDLDVKQLAVAELMAWGWDPVDAMLVVGVLKNKEESLTAQHAALTYTSDDAFSNLYKKRVAQLKNGSVLDEYQKIHPTPGSSASKAGRPRKDGIARKKWQGDEPTAVPDEEILAAMWETITRLAPSDPKRVDLLDKYDKLKRRQGAGEDDTTIHFYLPRPECDTCPFRGNAIITEPEPEAPTPKTEQEKEEEAFREIYPDGDVRTTKPGRKRIQKEGYSENGKKLGRPSNRTIGARKAAETKRRAAKEAERVAKEAEWKAELAKVKAEEKAEAKEAETEFKLFE